MEMSENDTVMTAVPTFGADIGAITMAKNDLGAVLKRIDKRLEALKLSDRAASLAARMSADGIRTMRRQWKSGAQKNAVPHTISLLARPLQTTADWLMHGIGPETIQDVREQKALVQEAKASYRKRRPREGQAGASLKIIGEAAAGRWFEVAADAAITLEDGVPAHPHFPTDQQFAVVVRGNSLNRVARDGDFLIALDPISSNAPPHHGDLVVVERKRGDLHELSGKRYNFAEGDKVVELHNDSVDTQFQDVIIRLAIKRGGEIAAKAEDDSDIVIKGVVVGIFRLP